VRGRVKPAVTEEPICSGKRRNGIGDSKAITYVHVRAEWRTKRHLPSRETSSAPNRYCSGLRRCCRASVGGCAPDREQTVYGEERGGEIKYEGRRKGNPKCARVAHPSLSRRIRGLGLFRRLTSVPLPRAAPAKQLPACDSSNDRH